jgi:hypothetical protein
MRNRMTLREGYQTTGVQNLGRMADALHYALISSVPPGPAEDPVIQLFPAWPDDWDADFKLLCRGNFLIESSYRNGKVIYIEILSQSGSVCKLLNPWANSKVISIRNGKKSKNLSGKLLTINIAKGDKIRIIPQ